MFQKEDIKNITPNFIPITNLSPILVSVQLKCTNHQKHLCIDSIISEASLKGYYK